MKNFAAKLIAVLKAIFANSNAFTKEHRLTTKLIAVFLMTALLMPLIFLGDWQKAAAQISTAASQANLAAPISAPPQAFIISSSDSVSAKAFGLATNFNASVINSYGAVASFVTAPVLLEGFEMAQPVSPLYASVVSMGSYLGTFLGFSNPSSVATNLLTTQTASNNTEYDFDGDNKSDVARWKPSTSEWQIKSSNGGSLTNSTLGTSASVLAPGDFDGDLKTDTAVFNSGTWTIKPSGGSSSQYTISWGTTGDIPVTGDYNGDGRSDYAIYRPSTGTYWIQRSNDLSYYSLAFGTASDIKVPGDYDGDGKTDIAVYRPSDGNWYIIQSSNGQTIAPHWGVAEDIPVPADYDGDGLTDLSVYRPSSGTWFIYKSSGGGSYIQQVWGNYGDQPVPADYDGDGKADLSIWRPKTGVWFTYKSCNFTSTCGTNPPIIYETLGMNGDVPVEAAYIKKIGGLVQDYDQAKLRLSPKNATGGTDLYSRNFSWGTGLVGLPGRAGLNAGFGISYNSLVWLKDTTNNVMIFDPDQSNVSPGFKMGFPTIEPVYYDSSTGKFAYLMVTPSGARVEFKQTAASDTYETVDSSYVQLKTKGATNPNDPVEDIGISITGTDGTQMNYEWLAGAFRCNQIKDRNGNFITIVHDQYGLLRTVTDTLGRVITVNYDTEFYPTSITQDWKDNNGAGSTVTRTWATFGYTNLTMNPSFDSSLSVFGPANNTVIKVLDKVVYGSPSSSSLNTGETRFEYNSFGQVKKVRNMAADGHELNYVITNLNTPGTNLTDVPRLSQTKSWAENFNGGAEIVVNNTFTENQTIPEAGGTGTKIEVSMVGHPHGAISKTFVGSSGWMESLPIVTEDWADNGSGVARQRWTQTVWTQDNTSLSYILNPRVTETKVGDTANTKRTTIEYYPVSTGSPIALYGLPFRVRTYAADQTTVWQESTTEYNLDNSYVSRRIIGLPSKTENSGFDQGASMLKLVSKVTYNYDEGNLNDSNFEQNISSVIRHDNTNYSASFVTGRGNLTRATRWNVDFPTSSSEAVSSSVKYNIAGAVVAQTDPLNRTVKISYADQFNDTTTSRNTFAYPTKLTDPANNYSEVKYRFDIGANVWAKSPAPAGNTSGKETTREYDLLGRLLKDKIVNHGGAYTRYEYPTNGIQSKVFSTLIDTNSNNTADSADEVYSESITDGAGRVLRSRINNPGSVGGWSGSLAEYDILGRLKRSTVPTEINQNYEPAGDDSAWLWKENEYDWKNRVKRLINPDGTDRLFSYDGCGCAGGQITTVQDVSVQVPGQSTFARRTQKYYADILGRMYKSEVLNWDSSIYSTAKILFNGRDQAIETKQFQGTDTSSIFQTITATYDGHGRLKTKHVPEQQDSNGNPTFTSYEYNLDDSAASVTDARGVITNYEYNYFGQVDSIDYVTPQNSTIPSSASISFDYDNLGNRISMEDGLGIVDYEYDELSRLTAETRDFTDTLPNAPSANNGNYRFEYEYTLSGQLKSLTDPFEHQTSYSYDATGRLSSISTNGYGDLPQGQVVSNMQYRAFGSLKQASYANGTQTAFQYNNRLQPTTYRLTNTSNSQILLGKDYSYTTGSNNDNDGRLKKSIHYDDTVSNADEEKNNRYYTFDHVGRIKTANTGEYACYSFGCVDRNGPFQQTYNYNAFDNLTQVSDRDFGFNTPGGGPGCYGCPRTFSYSESITNNRTTSSGFSTNDPAGGSSINTYIYDNDGRLTNRDGELYGYDAAGLQKTIDRTGTNPDSANEYDGNGKLIKWSENNQVKNYYLPSSLLDVTGMNLTPTGAMDEGYIYSPTGAKIASLKNNEATLIHEDPAGDSVYRIKMDKTISSRGSLDPMGRSASTTYPGSVCTPPGCYGPNGNPGGQYGGFDSLSRLINWRYEERLRERQFWSFSYHLEQKGWRVEYESNGSPNAPQYYTMAQTKYMASKLEGGERIFAIFTVSWISINAVSQEIISSSWGNSWTNLLQTQNQKENNVIDAKRRKLNDKEQKVLKDDIAEMLKVKNGKETCLEKLNKLLKELGSKYTDFNNLTSDIFSGKNGYKLRITNKPVENADGSAVTSGGLIVLNSIVNIENHNIDFIHEVFHAANKKNNYLHYDIAKAIASVEGLNIRRFDNWFRKNAPNVTDPGGGLLNSFIGEYCSEDGSSNWAEWLGRFI